MGTPDPTGAEAAAEYFVELYHYVLQTGDTSAWDAASEDGCGFCTSTRETVQRRASSGETYHSDGLTVHPATMLAFDETFQIFAVQVPFEFEGAVIRDASGEVTQEVPPSAAFLRLEVGFQPGVGWWLVTGSLYEESLA